MYFSSSTIVARAQSLVFMRFLTWASPVGYGIAVH
jgi:hypothetical protein